MGRTKKSSELQTAPTSGGSLEALKALVRQHRICWEVLPEQVPVKGQRPSSVGFNLMLYGAHPPGAHALPGCVKCKRIYSDLRKIANWIVPKEERDSRYDIPIYDSAIRYSPLRSNRPDVTVVIQILHRSEFDMPLDECEVRCLEEMKAKLSLLGAQEKHWIEQG